MHYLIAMAVQQSKPTYKGRTVEVLDTETHHGRTMHHVRAQDGASGWVYESEMEMGEDDE